MPRKQAGLCLHVLAFSLYPRLTESSIMTAIPQLQKLFNVFRIPVAVPLSGRHSEEISSSTTLAPASLDLEILGSCMCMYLYNANS